MKSLPFGVFLATALLVTPLAAQLDTAVDAGLVVLPTAVKTAVPVASLKLKPTEASRLFTISLQSDEDKPMQIVGVQTTSGLYLVDYPKTISAKGKGTATLIYFASQTSNQSADLLRLMTDQGLKVIQFNHDRDQVVHYDTTNLQWQQGEAATTKYVIATIPGLVTVPKTVQAMGPSNRATIESLGGGQYRIGITPGSTAQPQRFPVFLQFVPTFPGIATVISCEVLVKN